MVFKSLGELLQHSARQRTYRLKTPRWLIRIVEAVPLMCPSLTQLARTYRAEITNQTPQLLTYPLLTLSA